jgi:tripartite-type tricarboxylate transporter receptor subunit TctC
MKTTRLLSAIAGLAVFGCGMAWSQQYPAKPVRVVVVFPAGGGTDITARIVFQKVSEQMNQQFPIDNRGGAAGMIGAAIVAKSPPDGYTIMVYSQTFTNNFHLYPKKDVPYELKDFAAVSMLVRWVGMLTVHPSMPVRTTKEFIALAKARPGEILYGSAGIGAYQHLSMSVLLSMSGIKATHVPFKGGAPAVVALVGGEVQAILTPIAEVYPHIQPGGRLRPIAVSSPTRTTQFPNIPAIAETVKGYDFTSWFGCLAPAGTPKPIIDRLSAEIKKALADPDVIAKLAPQVLDPMHQTPEEFTRHLKAEYDRMREVVKLSGARIE